MSITGARQIQVAYTGDFVATETIVGAANTNAPGPNVPVKLASGDNTIAVPIGATAVTIRKPTGNTVQIKLKNVSGDTGLTLHNTEADSFSLDSSVTSFVLNAAAIVGVELLWS